MRATDRIIRFPKFQRSHPAQFAVQKMTSTRQLTTHPRQRRRRRNIVRRGWPRLERDGRRWDAISSAENHASVAFPSELRAAFAADDDGGAEAGRLTVTPRSLARGRRLRASPRLSARTSIRRLASVGRSVDDADAWLGTRSV